MAAAHAHHGLNHEPLSSEVSFAKIKDLGSGSFGQVGLYRRLGHDEPVAVKCLPVRVVEYSMVKREVSSHAALNHPHVILFKRLGLTPDKRFLYMIMEYADHGDLFKYVQQHGRLTEGDARWFFQQIILGLDYCHRRGVVNRDLKLENLLLRSAADAPPPPGQLEQPRNLHIKVADFGLCKASVNSLPKSRVGTLYYLAPEVLRASADRPYDAKLSDIWSVGVILYVLLYKAYPFGVISDRDNKAQRDAILRRIANAEWQLPAFPAITDSCRDLLSRILVSDPARRITMEGILTHPWFREELPEGALEFNEGLVAEQAADPPRCEQSMEEIDAILRAAEEDPFHQAGGGAGGTAGGGLGTDGCMGDMSGATATGGAGATGARTSLIGSSGIDDEIDELHAEHPSMFDMGD